MRGLPLLLVPLSGCSFIFLDEICPFDESWDWLATGGLHTCGLHRNGEITCWGADDEGQLQAPPGPHFDLTAGYEHSCALAESGDAVCWGRDDFGQATAPAGSFEWITAGGGHSCALDAANQVRCWGRDDFGQATPPPGNHAAVSAGWLHTCVVDTDVGSVTCVGDDRFGQASPPALTGVTAIDAGQWHSCALSDQGTTCWGLDEGQLAPSGGDGGFAAGTDVSCALQGDGSIACVGADVPQNAPPAEGTFLAIDLAVGGGHGCAIEQLQKPLEGTWMVCWGLDQEGQTAPPREEE